MSKSSTTPDPGNWKRPKRTELPLECIRTDGGTQMRVKIDDDILLEYRDKWQDNIELPPIVVFYDGKGTYWLADGFHRFYGAREAKRKTIPTLVYQGTVRDAVLFAAGANADHGLRRTNADKRLAVKTLLDNADWFKWSDRKIAEVCRVTHPFVAGIRSEVVTVTTCEPRIGKDGKSYTKPSSKPAIKKMVVEMGLATAPVVPTVEVVSVPDGKPKDIEQIGAAQIEWDSCPRTDDGVHVPEQDDDGWFCSLCKETLDPPAVEVKPEPKQPIPLNVGDYITGLRKLIEKFYEKAPSDFRGIMANVMRDLAEDVDMWEGQQ